MSWKGNGQVISLVESITMEEEEWSSEQKLDVRSRQAAVCGEPRDTHASRRVRSSQNLSQKVERFLMRSTLVLSVRGSVPPLLLPDTPVAILCSDAELLPANPPPAPRASPCDSDRCIARIVDGALTTLPLRCTVPRYATAHTRRTQLRVHYRTLIAVYQCLDMT
ncbi:hypothetical protein EVAR_16087_1 [Eumeta japonica]|uniref:Uncharacterized protein n=1 Tax=Eumeta variegata TaxID=151549 RepID=A0A4C1UII0_EUMVA|nr:hypothetical protein EVAR_16087_1 [Eumeta japonica]